MNTRQRPELLSPAGNWNAARAAVENGADAIYFGLDCGFNARYRAANFGTDDLAGLMTMLRSRGVRGYVTMNTLVFASEMPSLVNVIERVADAGVDAVLVQDFGVARLVREICPQLEIHASTQMSLTSAETIAAVAERLHLARVVLARELSVSEIAKITAATSVPVEVFIHGALCVAYSGQCLTSESLGGRSANRGQCAQACRLPYDLIADGVQRDLGDIQYLLSPQDLAGYEAIDALIDAGVASLKIEGRLKTPEYVAGMTAKYRSAIDASMARQPSPIDDNARREMELSFSRGFTPGWLDGNDHKRLVPGLTSAKQGIRLGTVIDKTKTSVCIRATAPVATGDGIAIATEPMIGSRVYEIDIDHAGDTWLDLGRGFDTGGVEIDTIVYKNDDPKLNRRLRSTYDREDANARTQIDIKVTAHAGSPLRISAQAGHVTASVFGQDNLPVAMRRPIDAETLREKVGALGGTTFELATFEADIVGNPMVPLGGIKRLRRQLTDQITAALSSPPKRGINVAAGRQLLMPIEDAPASDITDIRTSGFESASRPTSHLAVLCRTLDQVRSVAPEVDQLMVDLHDVRQYREAVEIARASGTSIAIASVRIQKPGEMGLLRVLPRVKPDAILCRNLAALEFARQHDIAAIADFSLNVTNHRSAEFIRSLGAQRMTASYDLNADQLSDLIESIPSSWIEVVLHQHMPMFHMEHCVYCSVMSPGTNKTNCGRPCDVHQVNLRDRVGALHVLQADVACRNTLYNERPQSGAEIVDELRSRGVVNFRVELLEEDAKDAVDTIRLYRRLLNDQINAETLLRTLGASNRVGVTRGTLEEKRNPLAIL